MLDSGRMRSPRFPAQTRTVIVLLVIVLHVVIIVHVIVDVVVVRIIIGVIVSVVVHLVVGPTPGIIVCGVVTISVVVVLLLSCLRDIIIVVPSSVALSEGSRYLVWQAGLAAIERWTKRNLVINCKGLS